MPEVIYCDTRRPQLGESKTVSFLRRGLAQGTHVILANYNLRDGNSTLEIDVVVINRFGVWLLEVKDWYGSIRADDINWQQGTRPPVKSPITSIDHKARVMAAFLGRFNVSVTGFVVLVRGTEALQISDPRRDRVFGLTSALINALTSDRMQARRRPPLAPADVRQIQQELVDNYVDPGQEHIGSYHVVRTIRELDGVTEFEAEHTSITGLKARIKKYQVTEIISHEDLEHHENRFKRDIEALTALGPHPNLLAARDFFKAANNDEFYYLILEWVDGQTVQDIIEGGRPMPLRDQGALIRKVAEALDYCHKQGVIHRNLAPDNIYLTNRGIVKIGDFDFAKLPMLGRTITGRHLAKTVYTAPEQISKPHEVDGRADIYALGAVWFDLLRGSTDDSPIEITLLRAKDVPTQVCNIIDKMTATRRIDRYQTCNELIQDLKALP